MKITSDKWQVASDTNRQPVRRESIFSRHPSPVTRHSQHAVALVLTLILLSVTLVMALAFLAISGHERGSVTTQTDTATTRLAAEAGLAAAEAQIAANILSSTNPYSFGLLVSTNYAPYLPPFTVQYLATNVFISPRAPVSIPNPTNPSAPLDFRFYLDLNRNGVDDPNGWVPETNSAGLPTGNYVFEVGDPEWIGVLERPDQPHGPNNHFIARYAFIAVPVGNTLDLNAIHNQALQENTLPLNLANDGFFRNQGVGSWEINLAAFLADLNTNEWDNNSSGNYLYNQANPFPTRNSGAAFNDAFVLLTNRYAGNYSSLAPVGGVNGLFTNSTTSFPPFQNNIDFYSDGPLQTTTAGINEINQNVTWSWAGADNTNHFFTPDDLFNPNETASFGVHLLAAGANTVAGNAIPTYDRYTFYRMLSQLGTDTTPESGKMNLNYDNLDPFVTVVSQHVVTNAPSATNFMAWQPLAFFTAAADRLLKAYTAKWATTYTNDINGVLVPTNNPNFVATFNVTNAFGVTSIPVLVSNQFVYTPAVNRLLQLAANMYDSTTTNFYPDIFRPLFTVVPENGYYDVYITGYTNQPQITSSIQQSSEMIPGANGDVLDPPIDATTLAANAASVLVINQPVNVYGVPWIVGAKKGFPNFNAFSVESAFQLVRKLEVMRDTNAPNQPDITWTNQMYLMNITNYMGLSCWNSYQSNYPGTVDILVRCSSSIMVTNDNNMQPPYVFVTNFAGAVPYSFPGWNGVVKQQSGSFFVPLSASVLTLTNAVYYYNEPNPPNYGELINYLGDSPINYLDKGIQPLPHFWLQMTNRLQVAIIDYSAGPNNGRIVDYVQLGGMDSSQPLNSALDEIHYDSLWNTNHDSQGNLLGVYNQIQISTLGTTIDGQAPTGSGVWTTAQIPGLASDVSPAAQQAFFRAFFAQNSYDSYGGGIYNNQSAMQAPYTPMAFAIQHTTWEANDPLVHYLSTDLAPYTVNLQAVDWDPNKLRVTNDRYQPWEAPPPAYYSGIDQNPANLSFKDPLVRGSDNWDFPANKLPTVGWLGRVHRGTPWQTVYLKATNVLDSVIRTLSGTVTATGPNTWVIWTGDANPYDATNAAPAEDRMLFDLFTTAFNDNATRGQLSVNISSNSLAAWSAVFSGVTVLSNNLPNFVVNGTGHGQAQRPLPPGSVSLYTNPPSYLATNIQPAGTLGAASPLAELVAGIDQTRATFTNADGLVGAFEHEGDILATPQLAEQSPFLNWNNTAQQGNGISDEMYEWLPQQVMSLVRVGTPRYVIYSYGQALKPAPNGVYLGTTPAGTFGMVTNYQVVSEIATRTVLRIETVRTNQNGTITVTPPHAVIEQFNILPPD